MNSKVKKRGIKERIEAGVSIWEINSLLTEIRGYKKAHLSTIRKCERAAERRLQALRLRGRDLHRS